MTMMTLASNVLYLHVERFSGLKPPLPSCGTTATMLPTNMHFTWRITSAVRWGVRRVSVMCLLDSVIMRTSTIDDRVRCFSIATIQAMANMLKRSRTAVTPTTQDSESTGI